MSNVCYSCCNNGPKYLITYKVAEEEKTYQVCESCAELECFKKHVINKCPFGGVTTTSLVER